MSDEVLSDLNKTFAKTNRMSFRVTGGALLKENDSRRDPAWNMLYHFRTVTFTIVTLVNNSSELFVVFCKGHVRKWGEMTCGI